jgi:hypothetical protein
MDEHEIFEEFAVIVGEMTSDATTGMVPLSSELVQEVTAGDPDPRFATFVIESGWSNQRRYWGAELFDNVAEQINNGDESIVGYLGHIRPEDDGYSFPEIQMQWLKARVQRSGDKAKLAVKAYVLPGTKGRDYLKRRLVKTVSWRGSAIETPYEKGVRVSAFNIESIDLSRPRKAGMSARLVGALTSEMETEGRQVKPEEIAVLTPSDLRAHAPAVVSAIEAEARKALETQVSEMTEKVEEAKPEVDKLAEVRKALGISDDADPLELIRKLMETASAAGKTVRNKLLDEVLGRKFKDDTARALVRRVLATEMENRVQSGTIVIQGVESAKSDDEKVIEEMVVGFVDSDEQIQKLVSEMEPSSPLPPTTGNEPQKRGEWKAGHSTSNVRVRSAA